MNHESLIMQQYTMELRSVLRSEIKTDWGRNKAAVWRLLRTASGWSKIKNAIRGRIERARQKARMQRDQEYRDHKKALARARTNRRTFTDNQIDRRRELERKRYHTTKKTNPAWKVRHNLRTRLRKFLNGHKSCSMPVLLGCSHTQIVAHLESLMARGMTWKNYGTKWEIDHIIPCVEFDLTTSAGQRACFHFSNLRPLWVADNRSKSAKRITHQPEFLLSLK